MVHERSEMGILWTERSMVRAICGLQLKDRKTINDFTLMLGLNDTMSVNYYKQCVLVWSCVDEGRWPCVEEGGWSCVD